MLPLLSATNRFTVEFCHERARECLALTLEPGPQTTRHILEHIAECWSDIALELIKADPIERSASAKRSTSAEAARR